MTTDETRYTVPGLDRALTVLELLTQHPDGLGMVEIAEATGLPNNSVFRITATLSARGYLARSPETKRFALTRKFLQLAFPALHQRNIVEVSLDVMRELRDQIQESALLGTWLEDRGVTLAQVAAPHPIRLMVDPGTRFDLYCCAPGKAMLAYLPEERQNQLIDSFDYQALTPHTITSAKRLRKELAEVRRCGYALDHGESFEGIHCIAAPVLNEHAQVVAAVWVSGPSTRLPEEALPKWGPTVAEQTARISRRLGYYEPTFAQTPPDEPEDSEPSPRKRKKPSRS